MKLWEAMKSLEEGKKVRRVNWKKGAYIYKDLYYGDYMTEENLPYLDSIILNKDTEWELYDDRKECPECYKELYRAVMKVFDVDEGDDGLFDEFDADITGRNSLGNMYVILNDLNKEYKLDK